MLYYDMTLSEDGDKILDKSGLGNDGIISSTGNVTSDNHSLFMEKGGYVTLPKEIFIGKDTLTISVWLNNYSGTVNTSALYIGTTEELPHYYWTLNPCNPAGRMKSVITNSKNPIEPFMTETGISPAKAENGIQGPPTGMGWNHYVTILTKNSITSYFNGELLGTLDTNMSINDFGNNLVAYIGKSSYVADATYTGYIRELRIDNKVWTTEEVKAEYEKNKIERISKSPVTEILVSQRADPYIIKSEDGYYYFTASYPMCGEQDIEGYDRVILRRAKTIDGLREAKEITIWDEKDSDSTYRFIWAPEMHKIGGVWYIYYAGSDKADNRWAINCRVLRCTGDDPYSDKWEEVGKFTALENDENRPFTEFSLDMTYFECNGKHYVIWAQLIGHSNLYMAEIDPIKPWQLKSMSIKLSAPTYYWERVTFAVNEGPSVIQRGDKIFVVYSASATGPEYCLGMLYAHKNADLMDLSSWTKAEKALLTSEDLTEEYGPGHNSFTIDLDGNDVFVYHSRSKECFENRCNWSGGDPLYDPCRSARVRTVIWTKDGYPILNGVMPE